MNLNLRDLYNGVKSKFSKLLLNPYSNFNINWIVQKKLKHSKPNKEYTHLYKNKYLIHFNDPRSFLYTVKELFLDEIYKFNPLNDAPYIIDCGAYIGTSILYFKTNYPNAKILAFEPDNINLKLLNKNLSNWNFKNVEIQDKAVWINNDILLFKTDGNMASKIIGPNKNKSNSNSLIETKSIRLKDLLDVKTDFLKLDIEGAEYEVIKDCSEKLGNVQNLFIEYHGNYDEMYKLNEILNIVLENKFKYYIKEASSIYNQPFCKTINKYNFDVQLNIFAFRR